MDEKPLKIHEYTKENQKRTILLMPTKDGKHWQYINVTKGYICPCEFNNREEALMDFVKYSSKLHKVEFEELDVQ